MIDDGLQEDEQASGVEFSKDKIGKLALKTQGILKKYVPGFEEEEVSLTFELLDKPKFRIGVEVLPDLKLTDEGVLGHNRTKSDPLVYRVEINNSSPDNFVYDPRERISTTDGILPRLFIVDNNVFRLNDIFFYDKKGNAEVSSMRTWLNEGETERAIRTLGPEWYLKYFMQMDDEEISRVKRLESLPHSDRPNMAESLPWSEYDYEKISTIIGLIEAGKARLIPYDPED